MNNMPTYNPTTPYIPYVNPPIPQISYPNNTLRTIIPGRSVASVDEITPGEVPMDGSLSVFPKSDGTAVYIKSFNGDGTISTRTFVPAPEDYTEGSDEQTQSVSNQDIMNSLLDITNQISNVQDLVTASKNVYSKNNRNKNHNQQHQKEGAEANA